MELVEASGRWVWTKDSGFHEYVHREAGRLAGLAAHVLDSIGREPEHHVFQLQKDGCICLKVFSSFHPTEGATTVINPSGVPIEGEHDLPVHGKVKGVAQTVLEGNRLTTRVSGDRTQPDGSVERFEVNVVREVKDGEYHLTIENPISGNRCTRIFKRFPCYIVENVTGSPVTLTTFNPGDVLHMVAAMTVEVPEGLHFVGAPAPSKEEQQAVFCLPDGRKYSGITLVPFEKYVLTLDQFN